MVNVKDDFYFSEVVLINVNSTKFDLFHGGRVEKIATVSFFPEKNESKKVVNCREEYTPLWGLEH